MRTHRLIAVAGLTLLAACGGSDEKPRVSLGQPTDTIGLLTIQQNLAVTDPERAWGGPFNYWDLERDLSLSDGSDDQFDGALELSVGTLPTQPPTFESVLAEAGALPGFDTVPAADVRFFGPTVQSSLVAAATLPRNGGSAAELVRGASDRLSQAVDLTTATGVVRLSLNREYNNSTGLSPVDAPFWRIQLLHPTTGEVLKTIEEDTAEGSSIDPAVTADLSDLAGQRVVLAFEKRSDGDSWVDDVSIKDQDGSGVERVQNGDFETGDLTGWTATVLEAQPTGISHATPQALADLEVTRHFYATPGKYWGRWADTFHNPGAAEVTRDVVYRTNLGSDDCGVIYDTPGAAGAITSWDLDTGDRDVALISGSGEKAETALYQSATTATESCDGDDDVYQVRSLTIPAGGTVTLVHYVVMTGVDTGSLDPAPTPADHAELADELAAYIAGHYAKDVTLRHGMTQAQLDTVVNF